MSATAWQESSVRIRNSESEPIETAPCFVTGSAPGLCVANVTKHAEGNSADQLRKLRPDLFTYPTFRKLPPWGVMVVRRPIAGEGIFVTEDEFKSFASAVRDFWLWLLDGGHGNASS